MAIRSKARLKLSKENVYKYVSDEDLLNRYVTGFRGFNIPVHSNLRTNDSNKSLHFVYKDGKARISDFGTDYIGLTVWQYLSIYLGYPDNNVGYLSLLDLVRRDFNLPLERYNKPLKASYRREFRPAKAVNRHIEPTFPWDIRYRERPLGSWDIDKEFWFDQYGITAKTLLTYNVKALESFTLTRPDLTLPFFAGTLNPSYAYVPHDCLGIQGFKRKIYTPYAAKYTKEENKWFNSLPKETVLGLPILPEKGEVLVIETSLKDTMTNHELFKNEDIWFVDVFAESVFLPNNVFENLKGRFSLIIYHGDNDEPGVRQAKLFSEKYNIPYFTNPIGVQEVKDSSDMVKNKGQQFAKKFLFSQVERIDHGDF